MKKIMILAGVLLTFSGYAQSGNTSLKEIVLENEKNTTPEEVMTMTDSYWTVSTISLKGESDIFGNRSKNNDDKIVKLRFFKNNRFEFVTYTMKNEIGDGRQSWTQVSGTVVFSKDAKGQQVFTTMADKGVYRIIKHGAIATTIIPAAELKDRHSNTYLWEKTAFREDPDKTYLLILDLDEHPGADITRPESIRSSWISKFFIPGR